MQTFDIEYQVFTRDGEQADEKVENICVEQSVELPVQLLSEPLKEKVIGSVKEFEQIEENRYRVVISWPSENAGGDISTFLNLLYGNISLTPGVRVTDADWSLLNGETMFRGPHFGIDGIREKYGLGNRALTSTALKPLGLTVEEISRFCYEFASGGIDIIKDDHGITDQEYAPFDERVSACVNAVRKAADDSGHRALYFPNVTALSEEAARRYRKAARLGADGALICPHIAGLETMHKLVRMEESLPLVAHPAFSGTLTTRENQGLTPDFLYGQLWRALGADFSIYPNVGGRFSFTEEECLAINERARDNDSPFLRTFPMPGGGMELSAVPRWVETYGPDTVFLVGSSLYAYEGGKKEAAEQFRKLVDP